MLSKLNRELRHKKSISHLTHTFVSEADFTAR